MQPSVIKKRSIMIAKHKTSVSLEEEFWESLKEIAKGHGKTLSQVITAIDADRGSANMSSAARLFILRHYRDQVEKQKDEISPDRSHSVEHIVH